MSDETRELTRAVYGLTTKIELNTQETKNQTTFMKEQFSNGFASIIVNKLTKRFGIMVGTIGAILGIIMLFII